MENKTWQAILPARDVVLTLHAKDEAEAKEKTDRDFAKFWTNPGEYTIERTAWLDKYGRNPWKDPNAIMAMLRHGGRVYNRGFVEEPRERFTDHPIIDKWGDEVIDSSIVGAEGEAGYKRYAEIIGADYPDEYASEEEQENNE